MPHSKICINKFVFILSFLSENRRKGKEIFQTGKQYVTFLTNKTSFYKSERPAGRSAQPMLPHSKPAKRACRADGRRMAHLHAVGGERVPCLLRARSVPTPYTHAACFQWKMCMLLVYRLL